MSEEKITIIGYINNRIKFAEDGINDWKYKINQEVARPCSEPEIIRLAACEIELLMERLQELYLLKKEICDGSIDLDVISIEQEP